MKNTCKEKIKAVHEALKMYENRPCDGSPESCAEYWIGWIGGTVGYEWKEIKRGK